MTKSLFAAWLCLLCSLPVSAEVVQDQRTQLLADGRVMRDLSLDRLQQIRFAFRELPSRGQVWSPWSRLLVERTEVPADGELASLTARRHGVVLGVDRALAGQWVGGVLLGLLEADGRSGVSEFQSQQHYLGVYASSKIYHQLGFKTGALHAWQRLHTDQGQGKGSAYQGRSWLLFAEASYAMDYQNFSLEPYMGLSWQQQRLDDFALPTAAYVAGDELFRSELSMGWRLSRPWFWRYGRLTARANLSWHERLSQSDLSPDIWDGQGHWQALDNRQSPTSSVRGSFALDQQLADGRYLGLSYYAQLGHGLRSQGVSARLSWRF